MMRCVHACVILGLVVKVVQGASNATTVAYHDIMSIPMINETTPNVAKNKSAHYIFSNHKPVLVINDGADALRTRSRNNNVTSLKYIEYDDNHKPLNTVFMYNLRDVARFFEMYLDTMICHGVCDDETNTMG